MEEEKDDVFGGRPYWVAAYSPVFGSGYIPLIAIGSGEQVESFNTPTHRGFEFSMICPLCGEKFGEIKDPLCPECMKYYRGENNVHGF